MENSKNKKVILSVKDLVIQFHLRGRSLTAIRSANIDVYEGETLAIVGESGSGKSVLTKTWMGMLDSNGDIKNGEIIYNGIDISKYKNENEWRKIRGKEIGMVFQDPMTSLNPLLTIGEQIREAVAIHNPNMSKEETVKRAKELLEKVGIIDVDNRYKTYPHQFSGGMRQRVVIAIAIACNPKLLICDEPTTALDVTIQAQILELIHSLQKDLGITVVYITHDLGVVANVADRVAVMYAGEIVEYGLVEEIFYNSRHPYTWALLSSLPQLGEKGENLYAIEGTPPNLFVDVIGDAFAPRNPYALAIDYEKNPPFFKVSDTHYAKTWLLDPRAPKIEPPKSIQILKSKMGGVQLDK